MDMALALVTLQIWTVEYRGFILPAETDLRPQIAHQVKEVWAPQAQYSHLIYVISPEMEFLGATAKQCHVGPITIYNYQCFTFTWSK